MNLTFKSAAFMLCILVASQIDSGRAQQCAYEPNTNFYGNDIAYVYASCASSCCNRCYNQPGCTGWTYVEGYYNCWLKNFTTYNINRVACAGRTSGILTQAQPVVQPTQPPQQPCTITTPSKSTVILIFIYIIE